MIKQNIRIFKVDWNVFLLTQPLADSVEGVVGGREGGGG